MCRLSSDLLGQLSLATERGVRVYLDQAVRAHQEYTATLTEAEVVYQLRQLAHAQAQPGDADGSTGLFHAQVDEQRQFSTARIGIDIQGTRLAAVEKMIEPGVRRVAAAQGPVQPLLIVIVAAIGIGDQRGKCLVFAPQPFQVSDKLRRLGGILAIRQPLPHHAVVGDVRRSGQRLHQYSLDVVAHRLDAGRQRGIEQIGLCEAVDHRGIDADHDQNTDQQGRAHAQDQLPLDTAPPELHEEPRQVRGCEPQQPCRLYTRLSAFSGQSIGTRMRKAVH
ncbi:hypothetical protein D3C84_317770 [compost metagenome]